MLRFLLRGSLEYCRPDRWSEGAHGPVLWLSDAIQEVQVTLNDPRQLWSFCFAD